MDTGSTRWLYGLYRTVGASWSAVVGGVCKLRVSGVSGRVPAKLGGKTSPRFGPCMRRQAGLGLTETLFSVSELPSRGLGREDGQEEGQPPARVGSWWWLKQRERLGP